MKIKRLKVTSADTSKKDYILEVKNLLENHDCSNHNKNQFDSYEQKANELLKGTTDSDKKAVLILSA